MFPITPILKFLLIFFAAFVILIVPWPGARSSYAAVYRWIGNMCGGRIFSVVSATSIRFEPLAPGDIEDQEGRDTKVTFHHRPTGARMSMPGSTRFQGYTPTAFVIALILASPLPWTRRLGALVIGVLLVTVFVALRQCVFIVSVIYRPEGFVATFRDFAYWVFVESFAGVFVIPLVIWLIATFRRRDLEAILQRTTSAGESRTRSVQKQP